MAVGSGKLSRFWNAARTYFAHDDPLVATANLVALVVLWNQPFYPLYVYWSVGPDIAPTCYTFISTPFFLAVPALARVNGRAGRALLPLAGIGNTVLSAKVFGVASGVEIFLLPCVLLGFVLFRPTERVISIVIAAAGLLAFTALHGHYGEPVHTYSVEEYAGFLKMNALSAGTLTAFIGLLVMDLIGRRVGG
ncbi:hypothetical protein [Mesorhizobium sp. BH1-1-4]|uniref:hypothetical protein n=1 Tax=Mesorhizobium sp. BH1-1-4 TaxID=2876662 RepID=UPI001CD1169E|nr:hypothetical protein [Mesorhizobium sp. BH1-1-4]MBZ9995703.1 hypothetical protein [Mesorhizobium sp. BH1-1-4]